MILVGVFGLGGGVYHVCCENSKRAGWPFLARKNIIFLFGQKAFKFKGVLLRCAIEEAIMQNNKA